VTTAMSTSKLMMGRPFLSFLKRARASGANVMMTSFAVSPILCEKISSDFHTKT
jgi:hypothetical protein